MLKIWGRKNSSNVRKPLWAAEELGLAYEAIDAGGAFGVVDTPEYRAMNPNGRVPVIQDDGFVLWESNAIVRYLLAKHAADTSWYPADPQTRATADKWMDWTTSSFAGPFRTVFWAFCVPRQTNRTGRQSMRRSRNVTACWRWPMRR